jgi:isopenicillin-N N-acyltransferase-like protein
MTAAEALQGTLPVIDVAGSHREIGRGIGEALRDGLRAVAEAHRAGVERAIGWERALAIARGLIPATAAALPRCVDELRGMAEGSGVPFETLFSMNALQETRFLAGRDGASPTPDEEDEGCTSLAVSGQATADGHVLLAHNEDAGTIRHALPYVVRARPDGRPAFAGFAYSGLLLYQGMNDRGIGSVGNALYFTDIRPGTPKLLAYRDVLDAEFLEDAIRRTRKPTRANGNNHLLANAHGEIYDVEVSGGDSALLSSGDMLAHTNHAVDPRMRALEWGDPSTGSGQRLLNSEMRLRRVEHLLERAQGAITVDTLFDILSDHSNYPKSVCKHPDPVHNPDVMTVASVVIDLTAGAIHVRPGQPCQTRTTTVALAA